MKVIYHDKSGRHLSIVAAAIHLKLLTVDVSRQDLLQLPYFLHKKAPGTLLYLGLDCSGNEIYVLGRCNSFQIIRNAYLGINRAFELNQSFIFADVQPLANWRLKVYDILNQRFGETARLKNLVFAGIDFAVPKLGGLVREVQKKIKEGVK